MLEGKILLLHSYLCLHVFTGFISIVVASEIPLGSKLSAAENNYWVSLNGNFALGFFNRSDQPNLYSLGIRFNSIAIPFHDRPLVWVAGADISVVCDSYLLLTMDGDLEIIDSFKGVAWTSNTSHFSVTSAALYDNGNLVLLNQDQDVVWQSFLTPYDTLLPGQNLSVLQGLRAASRNAYSSYYNLDMDKLNQLKLCWETSICYWKSESSSVPIAGARFTSDGALQLLDRSFRPVWSKFGEDHNDSSVVFRFLRLDVDGNLRMYSWVEASKSWKSVWQAVENQCKVFATCGINGICEFTPKATTVCKCPYGSTVSSNSKCLAPYGEKCRSGSTMVALEHTFLYGLYPPTDLVTRGSLQQCRNSCLQDPLCTSVSITNDGTGQCLLKQTRFVTGYRHPSIPSISYVKVCLDPVAALPTNFPASAPPSTPPPLIKHPRKMSLLGLIGAALGIFFTVIVIQIVLGLFFFHRRKSTEKRGTLADIGPNSRGLIVLSYSEIKDLTGDFKHQLGPNAYKGVLPNNRLVMIKDLSSSERVTSVEEKQFKGAVSVIGSIHHKNLVRLEGYCCELDHRFLVYEYAKNGSVDKWIEEAKLIKKLTWRKRTELCLGVARAIAYLHMGCREFISHGSLKWENVVLDEELDAKVSEFGLRRVGYGTLQNDEGAEEDVARFGEMVISVVSGRQGGKDVCRWAYAEWAEGWPQRVLDVRIGGDVDPQELERMLRLAFWCVQVDERMRPSMGEVVKVLEGTLAVDPPPLPFTCQRSLEETVLELET